MTRAVSRFIWVALLGLFVGACEGYVEGGASLESNTTPQFDWISAEGLTPGIDSVPPLENEEPPDSTPEVDPCDSDVSVQHVVDFANDVLETIADGTWEPPTIPRTLDDVSTPLGDYLSGSSQARGYQEWRCGDPFAAGIDPEVTEEPDNAEAFCVGGRGQNQLCACHYISANASLYACNQIPTDCENKREHELRIRLASEALNWSFTPHRNPKLHVKPYPRSNVYDPKELTGDMYTDGSLTCGGSPLVIDLNGDGIRSTSAKKGTMFNLLGYGAIQTAWIQGDDALLVYDHDGDGAISSGRELFGPASVGYERAGGNGFEALKQYDEKGQGGNGDGVISAKDEIFSKLRLWRDTNGDGISQAAELSTLRSHAIATLPLSYQTDRSIIDVHGNQLPYSSTVSLKSGETRAIVDVIFSFETLPARRRPNK